MKAARRIEISAPVEARAAYLCRAYADMVEDVHALSERLTRLVRLQGRERVGSWVAMAENGQFEPLAAELIRDHYDPRYAKIRARYESEPDTVEAERLNEDGIAAVSRRVAELAAL